MTVALHDRLDYLHAYQKTVRTAGFGEVPLAFIEEANKSYVIHVQRGSADSVLAAAAHEVAHAVLSINGRSLEETGEATVEALIGESMPNDLAQLSLLGFLKDIKAFHDRPGVDAKSVRPVVGVSIDITGCPSDVRFHGQCEMAINAGF